MLDCEKPDVYQLPSLPRGHAALADQWRRAATAVPMNVAVACGKPSSADRANKFAIARGEAMECGAILDVVQLLDAVAVDELGAGKELVERSVRMPTKLCT